jgi:Flp pilus assembly protein TadG
MAIVKRFARLCRRCTTGRSERGAELIEFAIVLPVLLLIVMGIVDFGFMFQRYVVLTNAAMEGARVAVLPGYQTADVQARVTAYAEGGGIPAGTVPPAVVADVALPAPGGTTWPGKSVTVTHAYGFNYLGPIASLFGGGSGRTVTLTARSTMRSQVATAP